MLSLEKLKALNDFWQEKFDRKHPEEARKRKLRDKPPRVTFVRIRKKA